MAKDWDPSGKSTQFGKDSVNVSCVISQKVRLLQVILDLLEAGFLEILPYFELPTTPELIICPSRSVMTATICQIRYLQNRLNVLSD